MSLARRVGRAVEMIGVHRRTAGTLAGAAAAAAVDELLTIVVVELVAGAEPPPAAHGDRCWRKPGHHACAIAHAESLQGRPAADHDDHCYLRPGHHRCALERIAKLEAEQCWHLAGQPCVAVRARLQREAAP